MENTTQPAGSCQRSERPCEYLRGSDDFYWYKHDLDNKVHVSHEHVGTPEAYPCLVQSQLIPSGTDLHTVPMRMFESRYVHRFTYPANPKESHGQ